MWWLPKSKRNGAHLALERSLAPYLMFLNICFFLNQDKKEIREGIISNGEESELMGKHVARYFWERHTADPTSYLGKSERGERTLSPERKVTVHLSNDILGRLIFFHQK